MKNYKVTLALITGYDPFEKGRPYTKQVEFRVMAESERDAKVLAEKMDESKLSIWESYAEKI